MKQQRPAKKVLLVDDDPEIVDAIGLALASKVTRPRWPATATKDWR